MMNSLVEALNHNAFFSGGLSLMIVGAVAALLRKVPAQLWQFVERRLSITVEIPDRDPAFRWLQLWLTAQPYTGRARDLSLATTWIPAGAESAAAVVFDEDDSAAASPSSQVRFLLSPALVRPGRVDRKIELGHATADQARRLFLWFYQGCHLTPCRLAELGDLFATQVPTGRICMAAIQEHLLRHRHEPEAAAHEVDFDGQNPDARRTLDRQPATMVCRS